MRVKEAFAVLMLAACLGCSETKVSSEGKDKEDIKALEDRFMKAFLARDINGIMACYVPDQSLIVFDVTPPRQYTGAAAYRKDFEDFFAPFPGPLTATLSDLDITVGGDIAYSHSVQQLSMTDKDGKKFEMIVRVTDGYKRVNGQWLIAHEHVSVPVDLTTLKPDLNSK